MDNRLPWIGRLLGALGFLLGVVVGFRYLITSTPSNVWLGLGVGAIVAIAAWIYLDWDLLAGIAGRRGTRRQAGSWLMVALGLGIVVLVNYLGVRHHWEHDITEGSVHSLSEQTVDVLTALDEPVEITAFYRQVDGTGEAARERETFRKLTDRYAAHTDQLAVELIDPDIEPRAALELGVFSNGVVFLRCGDREEKVNLPDENDLTNALIKVTRDGSKKIYFLAGHGEHELHLSEPEGYSELLDRLTQTGFEVAELELYREVSIPDDATALVIAGPQRRLADGELAAIRAFVEQRGGGLLAMLDPEVDSGLEPMLAAWGIEVGSDLIVDVEAQALVGDFSTIFADPGMHEIVGELAVPAILAQARSVTPAEGATGVTELIRSGRSAWAETDLQSLEVRFDADVDTLGPVSLGAVVEVPRVAASPTPPADGPLRRDDPAGDGGAADGAAAAPGDDDSADPAAEASPADADTADDPHDHDHADAPAALDPTDATPAPVVVFGDSDFAANGALPLFGNGDLVLNSLSYLAREEDLITIRARDEDDRPMQMTGLQRALVMVIAVPGVTLFVALGAIVAWFRKLAR